MSRPRRANPPHNAGLVPPSFAATASLSRRSFLRSAALGGAILGAPGLLAACGGDDGGGGSGGDTVTFGMNESGDIPPADRLRAMAAAFEKKSGLKVTRNEVSHNTFQENINTYLQGNPDDVFTWFAGYRMNFFAEQGVIRDVSDVYPIDGINDSFKEAATASDGKQYFVPKDYYPWAVFYRKSVFEKNGFEVPTNRDDLLALCKEMEGKGITPFAFADKDGWPAMGTFDILNMRLNGFDFHMKLMAGEEAWDSDEVKGVFETWRELLPYHQTDALGRTWQEGAEAIGSGEAGMMMFGTFIVDAIPDSEDDLDFFTYPELDPAIGADALDAPIDGFCMAAEPDNEEGAKEFIAFLGTAEAADAANATGVPFIAANENASKESYSDLQRKSAEVVGAASNIAQFLDRDTRPDFAATVMIPSLQTFLRNPDDIDGLTSSIQQQKESIFVD
ncbi:MAG TPA: ABC transporter substrate-binding protein [Nocardioidaceae bacterium]|nr:ABC transporter substrate-binding protein [Nocardioidaceae bacterium]